MLERFLIILLRGYKRFLSPLLGQRCRFHPSCSVYAMTAIERHGAIRGSFMDPVPERFTSRFWARNPTADPPPDAPDR